MAHNHGTVYQVKVIHKDGTEELSQWIEQGNVPYTLAALHKPQATGYWLRERSVTVPFCPMCRDVETAVSEYPLTDHLSPRSHPHDSSYLVLTGAKDSRDVAASIPFANEPCLTPSSDAAVVTELMGGPSATQKLLSKKRTLRRITPRRVLSKGAERIDPLPK
jgi:hypothetical protein